MLFAGLLLKKPYKNQYISMKDSKSSRKYETGITVSFSSKNTAYL